MTESKLKVLVLKGGPDREAGVSRMSAGCVSKALREAGHDVLDREIDPDDVSALDETSDVVFPVMHGRWGEGGRLQALLEQRGLCFVGCGSQAARTAIDKIATKQIALDRDVATPAYQRVESGQALTLDPPLVLKPVDDGSSFGVAICGDADMVTQARTQLHEQFDVLLAEQYVAGREVTVGLLDGQPLPMIEIVPAEGYYDYQAKYDRDDTQYRFDPALPDQLVVDVTRDAVRLYEAIGCRHLSRVDFIIDASDRAWMLEINTMPGFTDHSLVPMAAAKAGLPMPQLCDRLVRLAVRDCGRSDVG